MHQQYGMIYLIDSAEINLISKARARSYLTPSYEYSFESILPISSRRPFSAVICHLDNVLVAKL